MQIEQAKVIVESFRSITEGFHKFFYYSGSSTWGNTHWMGVQTLKCPLDLWIYQEIIYEIKPDIIIETGTHHGGSALFLACICDWINKGRILTIDIIDMPGRPEHPRITYLHGSSILPDILAEVQAVIQPEDTVMVILDSDHTTAHVLEELRCYSPLVSRGSYLIVEDTNLNGHPVYPEFGSGPMEAVQAFLEKNSTFKIDPAREKFFLTFHPKGYLRKNHFSTP